MKNIFFKTIIGITGTLLMIFGTGVIEIGAQQQTQTKEARSAGRQGQTREMSPQNQTRTQSERTALEKGTPGARLYISPAALRAVQQKLGTQGYAAGNADGIWGGKTRQAVMNFQKANGLEPTGNLNLATIESLQLPEVLSGSAPQPSEPHPAREKMMKGPGAPLYISPSNLRRIQQKLNQDGYNPGRIDGLWGKSTRQAVKNYQQAQGLEPSGHIDFRLIRSLGLNQMIAGLTGEGRPAESRMAQQGATGRQQQQQRGYYGSQQGREGAAGQKQAAGIGAPLYVSPATVRKIQQALNQAGYQSGNLQGNWDKATSRALMNYQQAQGLEPTGNLNINTINKLVGGLNVSLVNRERHGMQARQQGRTYGMQPGQHGMQGQGTREKDRNLKQPQGTQSQPGQPRGYYGTESGQQKSGGESDRQEMNTQRNQQRRNQQNQTGQDQPDQRNQTNTQDRDSDSGI